LRILITFLLLIALAVGGWVAWAVYMPVTPRTSAAILLHSGYSTRRIAAELQNAGVIRSARAFRLWHRLHPQPSLKAGEYLFEKSANLPELYARIARGDIYFHTVTIPEGYTMFDIAKAMEDAGLGPARDFLHTAQTQTQLITDLAPEAKSLEGYLFPNTYEFTRTQSMQEMVAQMVHQFRQVALQIGLNTNVQQTVTMASIVEKEIIYALLLAGTYTGSLHHTDLAVNSPYNTYRFAGLPPGPIGNPGRTALEAALHPEDTKFLYFVSDGKDGHHRFAQSLEEHNRNVAAYRHALGLR
jgi:UPF0755 protein